MPISSAQNKKLETTALHVSKETMTGTVVADIYFLAVARQPAYIFYYLLLNDIAFRIVGHAERARVVLFQPP